MSLYEVAKVWLVKSIVESSGIAALLDVSAVLMTDGGQKRSIVRAAVFGHGHQCQMFKSRPPEGAATPCIQLMATPLRISLATV